METFGYATALQAVLIGVIATLVIDSWALILQKGFGLPTVNWGMVGRWFGHLPRGVLIHRPIGKSKAVSHERLIGWVAHYAIGVLYALGYLYLVVGVFSETPSLISALAFGLATLVAPWLILQPGLGVGVFARRAPRPGVVRLITLSVHALFGVSLFAGWLATQQIAA